MEFEVKPAKTCAGTQLFAPMSGKYLNDCQELCSGNAACHAFLHDETKNQCSLFTSCTLVDSDDKNVKTYMKVGRVAEVIAVGGTLDDDTEETPAPSNPSASNAENDGPHASYGNPDFEDVQDNVDDLGDSVKDLHDSLGDSVTDLQDEVKDLTDDIEESLTDLHDEMEESLTDLHDELEDSFKDLHQDLEEEVDNLNEDLADGLDEAQKAVDEIRAALADINAATNSMQPPQATYTGSQPAQNPPATYTGQPNMGAPTYYGGPATQPESNDDDETAWKTVAIVSMVLTGLLICGALICVVGYIGCMMKK